MTVEKLEKDISTLESRRTELNAQRTDHTQRADALEQKRREAIAAALAEGQPAPDSEKQLGEIGRLRQSATDMAAGIEALDVKLNTSRKELAYAQGQIAIAAAKQQIVTVSRADGAVAKALDELKAASDKLFADTRAVCAALCEFDAERFGPSFLNRMEIDIRQELTRAVSAFGFLAPIEIAPFGSVVAQRLRSAVAQLEFEFLAGPPALERGEKLYKVLSRITGLRQLDLKPGHMIGLRPDEAAMFTNGELQLVELEAA